MRLPGKQSIQSRHIETTVVLVVLVIAITTLWALGSVEGAGALGPFLLYVGSVWARQIEAIRQIKTERPGDTAEAQQQEREDTGRIRTAEGRRRVPRELSIVDDTRNPIPSFLAKPLPFIDRDNTPPETPNALEERPRAMLPPPIEKGRQTKADRITPIERKAERHVDNGAIAAALELVVGTEYEPRVRAQIALAIDGAIKAKAYDKAIAMTRGTDYAEDTTTRVNRARGRDTTRIP